MQESRYRNKIVTIPNILTFIRLLLVPFFVWACGETHRITSACILGVSGLTDALDGYIARKCNMESDLGSLLDPVADKVTQLAMCLALLSRYPVMFWVLIFFGVKELIMAGLGYWYLCKSGVVNSARWYGKASSIVQYVVILVLVINPEISAYSAYVLLMLYVLTHVLALLLYVVFYVNILRNPEREPGVAMRPIDWQVMVMYLLLVGSVFLLLFTHGESFLRDVLPKPIYLFLRFASIVGTIGIPAFFLGEKVPRRWFRYDAFPFRSFGWEKEGKIYEKIGIQWWKTHTPDMSKYLRRAFAKQGNLMRDPAHLRKLTAETCSAEFVHWMLVLLSPVFVVLMDECGILSMILYIVGNLVSIVIQRYNRPRIVKIIQRIEKRSCVDC